ncbi:hypothetical protein N8199_08760 [Emcibacteraceae bacterium]|nr:hypothetical protein [Emcibacteraceae bacterium]
MIIFPEELNETIKYVVEAANLGEMNPKGIEGLFEWLLEKQDDDEWNNIQGELGSSALEIVHVENRLDDNYDDNLLRDHCDLDADKIITEEMRFNFMIEDLKSAVDESFEGISFHTMILHGNNNQTAALGCTYDGNSYLTEWIGISPNPEKLKNEVRTWGYLFKEDILNLKPSDLLKYWGEFKG